MLSQFLLPVSLRAGLVWGRQSEPLSTLPRHITHQDSAAGLGF